MRDRNIIHFLEDDLEHFCAEPEAQVSLLHNLSFLFVIGLSGTPDAVPNYWLVPAISEVFPDMLDTSTGDVNMPCYFFR
jgi:hypothetical protein